MIMAPATANGMIGAEMIQSALGSATGHLQTLPGPADLMTMPLRDARRLFEKNYLNAQVARFGGNISRTAQFVGMERSALHRKLRSLGMLERERESHGTDSDVAADPNPDGADKLNGP